MVRDLVIVKTFVGLRAQYAIIKKVAEQLNAPSRMATASEEARGIDGMIGDVAVSVKPETYRAKSLPEHIEAATIYYEKTRGGLDVDYSEDRRSVRRVTSAGICTR
ncbi:MAG: MjaI family restriction endonuclease [Ignavibacteriales bacterium]|nr:MjaI family restriction endonuclease [Ignavibacteriales bacterium]